jgi:hypothetical protein
MQDIMPIWIGLGLVGALIYLIRTHYLAAFLRDQVMPAFQLGNESDFSGMLIGGLTNFVLVFIFLVIRNLPLWILAVILGPLAIVAALVVQPEKAIRVLAVDIERDARLDHPDLRIHYVAGELALQCPACSNLTPLDPCPDCTSAVYGPSGSGIRCRKCSSYIDRWSCPSCDSLNVLANSLVVLRPYLVAGAR